MQCSAMCSLAPQEWISARSRRSIRLWHNLIRKVMPFFLSPSCVGWKYMVLRELKKVLSIKAESIFFGFFELQRFRFSLFSCSSITQRTSFVFLKKESADRETISLILINSWRFSFCSMVVASSLWRFQNSSTTKSSYPNSKSFILRLIFCIRWGLGTLFSYLIFLIRLQLTFKAESEVNCCSPSRLLMLLCERQRRVMRWAFEGRGSLLIFWQLRFTVVCTIWQGDLRGSVSQVSELGVLFLLALPNRIDLNCQIYNIKKSTTWSWGDPQLRLSEPVPRALISHRWTFEISPSFPFQ